MNHLLLGVHCSVSGGLHHSFEEASRLGIDTFQIFTRNQRQWKAAPISADEKNNFSGAWKISPVKTIFSHASYLINLGSTDEELWEKSTRAITDELVRCGELGLSFTVLHPGSAKGSDEKKAIRRIATALQTALRETAGSSAMVLLENTAGQGSAIGYRFEHLAELMQQIGSARIGVCFDTCHAFAAGYDLTTEKGFASVFGEFDRIAGLHHLKALHLNDSKGELGSRIDRHDHIGKGKIGTTAFRLAMNQFKNIPKVIETDKENDMDPRNLEVLRSLVS